MAGPLSSPRNFLGLLCCCGALGVAGGVGCLDNDGNAVDWSFTYKMHSDFRVAYVDAGTPPPNSGPLQLLGRTLADGDDPVAVIRTLRALESREYIFYNDEAGADKASSRYGHTKGVVAVGADGGSGLWLLHSTPNFPSGRASGDLSFPEREVKYGQTFLCISLGGADVDRVAKQLLYTTPNVFESTLSDATLGRFPALKQVMDQDWIKRPGSNAETFQVGAAAFTHFAKNAAWNDDIYEGLIAPGYKTGFMVETWIRGHACGSYCRPEHEYDIVDVKSMVAVDASGRTVKWTEGGDHAKWAVALDRSSVVCVADINRMTTQRKRGGGALCFKHAGLAATLSRSVEGAASCERSATNASLDVVHV